MPKRVLETPSAPGALGPYSVAVQAGDFVFVSGQVAIDPATGERAPDHVGAQAKQIMENLKAILGDAGLTLHDVAKTTIFLVDMNDFDTVNGVYGGYFDGEPPARSTVQVAALPGGFLVEIEVIAARSY
ncbi:MAG: RidA family protein [Acidimicrobiia bacterium]|nr:RidA family protein [Acidimicrobiia bacterium]MDH3396742.1 RidA family protein [Acidimicrobiia bacterium]MDH5615794.1 RidA family protein [Acidimicrobiia bacterium]